MAISRCLLLVLLISLCASSGFAEIRFMEIRTDGRPIIPFDEFGFTHTGRLELNVSDIYLSNNSPNLDLDKVGFFLCTRDAWLHVFQGLEDGEVVCALNSLFVKVVSTFKPMRNGTLNHLYQETSADQYTLVFANCLNQVKVTMNVRSAMYNLDSKKSTRDYFSDGKTILPRVYFILSLAYFTLAGIWIYVLHNRQLNVFKIHFFVLALVILKAFNLVCESVVKSFIKRTGSDNGWLWKVLFYTFSFYKGIMFFALIVLIGTGWSFSNPALQYKDWKVLMVLMIVIPLQVVANIANFAIDANGPFAQDWVTWKQVFLLADVVCFSTVLFPICWSIKNLRKAAGVDGQAALYLKKLTLFRLYYFIFNICLARVVVFALEVSTCYKHLWTSVVARELAILAFYVLTGYTFKPETSNPYFVIEDEKEAARKQFGMPVAEDEKWKMIEENGEGNQTKTAEAEA